MQVWDGLARCNWACGGGMRLWTERYVCGFEWPGARRRKSSEINQLQRLADCGTSMREHVSNTQDIGGKVILDRSSSENKAVPDRGTIFGKLLSTRGRCLASLSENDEEKTDEGVLLTCG